MEQQPLLGDNEEGKIYATESDKTNSKGYPWTESLPFVVVMAFLWKFLAAVSKICVQALEGRVPAFELNAIRCFLMLCVWSLYFLFKRKLPKVERENIKATLLWSMNHIFTSLAAFTSVLFLPLATIETVTILSNILWTIFISVIVLKHEGDWSQVSTTTLIQFQVTKGTYIWFPWNECVAVFIRVYKNNVAVSCVGSDYFRLRTIVVV